MGRNFVRRRWQYRAMVRHRRKGTARTARVAWAVWIALTARAALAEWAALTEWVALTATLTASLPMAIALPASIAPSAAITAGVAFDAFATVPPCCRMPLCSIIGAGCPKSTAMPAKHRETATMRYGAPRWCPAIMFRDDASPHPFSVFAAAPIPTSFHHAESCNRCQKSSFFAAYSECRDCGSRILSFTHVA